MKTHPNRLLRKKLHEDNPDMGKHLRYERKSLFITLLIQVALASFIIMGALMFFEWVRITF